MGWYTACPGFLFAACMTGVLLGRGLLVSWSGLGKDVLTGQFLREKAVAAAGIKLPERALGSRTAPSCSGYSRIMRTRSISTQAAKLR